MAQNYTSGTVTVTTGSSVVTGSGTAWALALISGGLFCSGGVAVPIASVESDTSMTLALPWPGGNAAGAGYAIFRETAQAASAVMANDRLAQVAKDLRSPAVAALASLDIAANTLPYGTGPNTLGLTFLPQASRDQLGAGLGNAATKTMQSSTIDPTAGRVMAVGAFGLGGQDASLPTGTNLNNLGTTQFINPVDAFPGAWDSALGSYPMGFHLQRSATVQSQFAIGFSGTAGFRSKDGASWQAWRKLYHSHNVLAPVGLSSGVPTGGIIERGSNANGSYAKFADGTMICQHVLSVGNVTTAAGAVYRGAAATLWTFPASFITSPTICGADPSSYFVWIFSGPTNANNSNIMPFSSASISEARVAALTAIGRWN